LHANPRRSSRAAPAKKIDVPSNVRAGYAHIVGEYKNMIASMLNMKGSSEVELVEGLVDVMAVPFQAILGASILFY